MNVTLRPVAHIESDFPTKFGVPRQASMVPQLRARVIFEPDFRNPDALRGIEEFTWIWLLWGFSFNHDKDEESWAPLVRPPRLGGNKYLGVFATRTPYRPNPLGMSSVQLLGVEKDEQLGTTLLVAGADLVDGTPIYDIKPYVPLDCHPEATPGFTAVNNDYHLQVVIPPNLEDAIPENKREALRGILRQDPRPAYQRETEREYWLEFAGFDFAFQVTDKVLTVTKAAPKG